MSNCHRSVFVHVLLGGSVLLASAAVATARPPSAEPFGAGDSPFGIGLQGSHVSQEDGSGPGMQAAADHIMSFQCLDGGWGWPHTACPTGTFSNLTGPISLGLLRIWEVTGDAATLAAAVDGGDYDVAAVFPNATPSFGSFAAGFLHTLTGASGDSTYSDHAATGFFDRLTAGTYGDPTVSGGSFFPGDTYDYLDRHKSLRAGSLINLRPWDMQYMPWVAGLIGNPHSSGTDGVTQQTTFLDDGVLDGLNTLEKTVQYDLIGLAGGVRGLALNGTTTFAAISAPLFADIDTITDLCDLADVLVSFQNTDGSWSWVSSLQNTAGEQDTQTTAYAVLALIAADVAGCIPVPGGRYNSEIAAGRSFLDSMQDVDGGFFSYPGGTHNIEAESEAAHASTVDNLSLNTSACSSTGTVTVTVDMAAMPDLIVGGQFFLDFDDSLLTFVSAVPGGGTFDVEVFEIVGASTIGYAVGVTGGGPGTSSAETMAVLTFTATGEICTPTAALVSWDRTASPPSRLTNDLGDEILPTLEDLGLVTVDLTPPVITPPSPIKVNADAGGCDADVTVPALVASDACTGVATIVNDYNGTADASDNYPSGTTVVTWTVTDNCGNTSMDTQSITVNAVNDLSVAVELAGVGASVTRCITFELWSCPDTIPVEIVSLDLTFTAGLFVGTVEIPCGSYDCITARDTLHTLRRTDDDGDFAIVGTEYVADFTAAGTTDDSLIGGNLNDDFFIDILDYGTFVGQFSDVVGADTLCTATGPHADISGNGTVFTEDFTFITTNFLDPHEDNCCGAPLTMRLASGRAIAYSPTPVTRISAAQLRARGLDDLLIADLNHDGWLDVLDIQAFANGVRP